ncbi:MAG: DUF433 domain-containing protein [Pleurocapsa sp. MO_226.B13]|nr:DUF433 domain-containing protein [Pleurocapsa sp. MO_226.B13]
MNKLLSRITQTPGQCGGRPCIRGMRIRVSGSTKAIAILYKMTYFRSYVAIALRRRTKV